MNRLIFSSVISFVIIASVAVGVYFYQRYSIILTNPLKAVPVDAAFIIETKNAKHDAELFLTADWKKHLAENNWYTSFEKSFHLIDSLLSSNNSVKEIWATQSIIVSAHVTKANSFDFLFLTNAPRGWTERKIKKFLSDDCGIKNDFSKREYENVNIYETNFGNSVFTFALHDGVFISSFTSFLVEDAIRQLKSGNGIAQSKTFANAETVSEKNNRPSCYINYNSMRNFISIFATRDNEGFLKQLNSVARWSATHVEVLPNIISLSGYSSSADTSDFISLFRNQLPQRNNVTDILPSRTAMILEYGFNNYSEFSRHLSANSVYSLPLSDRKNIASSIEENFGISIEKYFQSWIGNDVALVITEPGSTSFNGNCYACIKAKNVDDAKNFLLEAQAAINKNSPDALANETYRNFDLQHINLDGMLPLMLGKQFNSISKFYFTAINNYIVVANSNSALRSFIDDVCDKKLINGFNSFRSLRANLNPSSNIFFYLNSNRGMNILKSFASDAFVQSLVSHQSVVNSVSEFAVQFVNERNRMKTQMVFQFGKTRMSGISLLWQLQLDTSISMPSTIMEDEQNQKTILVQDDKNSLYRIDISGNIVWKKELPEKIMSEIFQVDYYRNGGKQIFFNTAHQFFLFDLSGNATANYPIRLPAVATNGCSVFDFSNTKTYNIFIACSNNLIYGYELNGKPLSDWHYLFAKNVVRPIQLFRSGNKNFLLLSEQNGRTLIKDRKEEVKIIFDTFSSAENTSFNFVPKDSTHNDVIETTDATGTIYQLSFNSDVAPIVLSSSKTFSPQHAFINADVDGDGIQDNVFLDKNILTTIRKDGSIIFTHSFTGNIHPQIFKYNITADAENLFVIAAGDNKIFMLDKTGNNMHGFPLKGSTAPAINKTDDENKILVTTSKDSNVYVYKIE